MNRIKLNNVNSLFIERLNNSNFYKLDFGTRDLIKKDNFYFLIFIATLLGFSAIDVLAEEEAVLLAKNAINNAKKKSVELGKKNIQKPLLFASIKKDQFSNLLNDQISEKLRFFKEVDIDVLDIHLNENDLLNNMKKIDFICDFFKEKIISVNLSRKRFSNAHMVELLEKLSGFSNNNLFVEIEGMEFYEDDYSKVLQTVSTADIINKQFVEKSPKYKRIPLILGNYSNGKVELLARECSVSFNGISINYRNLNNIVKNKIDPLTDEDIKELLILIRNKLFKNDDLA